MLHAHPRIAMPPKTRLLLPVYFEENRRRLAARITQRSSPRAQRAVSLPRRAVRRGDARYAAAARDIVPDRKSWHDRTKGALDLARAEASRTELEPAEVA